MTFERTIIHVSFKYKNMKKIILAIAAATFMINMGSAQEEPMDLRGSSDLWSQGRSESIECI